MNELETVLEYLPVSLRKVINLNIVKQREIR